MFTFNFPNDISAVYIIYSAKDNRKIPIYVGESSSLWGRIGDYCRASFKSSTDFKVGEAIKYLRERRQNIIVDIRHKDIHTKKERKEKEGATIKEIGRHLLNELKGYNYKNAHIEEQRKRVKEFCDLYFNSL
ncbi:MAG: hypothetical protein PHT44_02535 [Candidatus Portnoybacteria bacterium]|nr:hypothetical protein [Candidatus Portnoybacteria bacterium]MDD4982418.1 hypothetical protein [Candidatus Portnoybacteria bacterium]